MVSFREVVTAVGDRLHAKRDASVHAELRDITAVFDAMHAALDRYVERVKLRMAEHAVAIEAHQVAFDGHTVAVEKALTLQHNVEKLLSEKP